MKRNVNLPNFVYIFRVLYLIFGIVCFVGIICISLTENWYIPLGIGFGGLVFTALIQGIFLNYTQTGKEYLRRKKEKEEEQERIIRERNEAARRKEEEKLANIRKTLILSHATLTDKDNAMTRGIVGMALVGTAGAVIGTSTAKERQTTTFLLVYNDESRETREVENGSELYNIYVQYLEV